MKTFNITAQAYNLFDKYKQTMLLNEVVSAHSKDEAENYFREMLGIDHKILKVYSIEEIIQVAS
jgi:hypothetical protein